MTAFTDVTSTDCPNCNRLICSDYLTCPGYLRDLLNKLEDGSQERRGTRQPMGFRVRNCPVA